MFSLDALVEPGMLPALARSEVRDWAVTGSLSTGTMGLDVMPRFQFHKDAPSGQDARRPARQSLELVGHEVVPRMCEWLLMVFCRWDVGAERVASFAPCYAVGASRRRSQGES